MDKEFKIAKARVTRRKFLKGIGLAAGTLALSGGFGLQGFAQPTVKVGTLFDYTGALAEFGPPFRNAAELAKEQINAAQDLFKLELIHEDSGTTAAIGIDKAKKLVEVDKVPAIVGSLASGVTIPIATTVTIPGKVLQISPASTSPLISVLPADVGQDFLFRTCPSDALQGKVLGMLAWQKCFRTASTIFVNNPYGQGLSDVFKETFEALGGKVLATVPHPEEPKPTYTSELTAALKDKPEVLAAISYPGHATVYLKEAIEVLKHTKFLYVDGTKSEEIIKAVGKERVEKGQGTAPGAAITESLDIFNKDYEKKFGVRPPLPFMTNTYDAVAVIALAIAKAIVDKAAITGTALRDRLRPVSNPPGEKVIAGLDGFKKAFGLIKDGKDTDYEGAAGAQDFDANGDVITPIEVWMYTKGTMRTLEQMEPSESRGKPTSSREEQPFPSDFVTGVKVAALKGAIEVEVDGRKIVLDAPDWHAWGRRPKDKSVKIHVQKGPADFIKYWILGG